MIAQLRLLILDARQASRREESFWEAVELADVLLLLFLDEELALQTGVYDENLDCIEMIRGVYTKAKRRFGSQRQWASVVDQLEFVQRMIKRSKNTGTKTNSEKRLNGVDSLIAHIT